MIANQIAGALGAGVPISTSSFESIATANGTGSVSTLTFSSIPSTFKHLQIRGNANDLNGNTLAIRFNSDTGSNYAFHRLLGNGATASATGFATQTWANYVGYLGVNADQMAAFLVDVHDYASTSKYKTIRTFTGNDRNGSGFVSLSSGLWQSTSAVTSIDLISTGSNNFTSNTTFALYGIKG